MSHPISTFITHNIIPLPGSCLSFSSLVSTTCSLFKHKNIQRQVQHEKLTKTGIDKSLKHVISVIGIKRWKEKYDALWQLKWNV